MNERNYRMRIDDGYEENLKCRKMEEDNTKNNEVSLGLDLFNCSDNKQDGRGDANNLGSTIYADAAKFIAFGIILCDNQAEIDHISSKFKITTAELSEILASLSSNTEIIAKYIPEKTIVKAAAAWRTILQHINFSHDN